MWPINDGVVGISAQRPEAQSTGREVGARVAAQISFREKAAGIVDRLFYPVSGLLAVGSDVRPDIEDVGFGESVSA